MTISKYGENAKFESKEIETLSLKSGQVLVKISASSINTVDTMIKNMGYRLTVFNTDASYFGNGPYRNY